LTIRGLAIFLVLLWGSTEVSAAPSLPCHTAAEYRAALNSVLQQTQDERSSPKELADALPGRCEFSVGGQSFAVSNIEIQNALRGVALKSSPEERKAALESAQEDIRWSIGNLDAYARPVDPTTKTKLQAIMDRKEFRHVGTQNLSVYLQEWAFRLLKRFFAFAFTDQGRVVLGAKILAWSLCIAVLAFVFVKLYRWATREAPAEAVREVIPFSPSAKNWRNWLKDAREAAANGEWRDAVHSAYWAVISQLEAKGTWRPDKARTPREYLGLIGRNDPVRPALRDITHDFETIWYGNRVPVASEWEAFLAKVESMGCR
jgi:hypothetical protein